MKVLLDHCVDRRFDQCLQGHEVITAASMRWETLRNGHLLMAAADAGFNVMVTTDKNLRHQQNLADLPMPVVQLELRGTRLAALKLLAPHMESALAATLSHQLVVVSLAGVAERLGPRDGSKK